MDSSKKDNCEISREEDLSPITEMTDDEKIDLAAAKILELYREAFLELAK